MLGTQADCSPMAQSQNEVVRFRAVASETAQCRESQSLSWISTGKELCLDPDLNPHSSRKAAITVKGTTVTAGLSRESSFISQVQAEPRHPGRSRNHKQRPLDCVKVKGFCVSKNSVKGVKGQNTDERGCPQYMFLTKDSWPERIFKTVLLINNKKFNLIGKTDKRLGHFTKEEIQINIKRCSISSVIRKLQVQLHAFQNGQKAEESACQVCVGGL